MSGVAHYRRPTLRRRLPVLASGLALLLTFAGQAIADTADPSALTITTTGLPAGTVGSPYPVNACPTPSVLASRQPAGSPAGEGGVPLSASGGTPPYLWSVIDGALPPGLTLDSESGDVLGTPKESGVFDFAVEVSDSTSPSPTTVSTQLSIAVGTPFDGAGAMTIAPTTIHTAAGGPLTFTYTAGVCGLTAAGEIAITVPAGWTSPSLTAGTPGFVSAVPASAASVTPSQDPVGQILATGVTLAAGQTLVISYGGDGGPIAPTRAETDTFPTSSRIGDGGRLVALVTSPSVSVIHSVRTLDGAGAMVVSPTSIHTSGKGPLTFTYTAGNGGLTKGGEVTITVPDGWRTPSPRAGRPTAVLNSPSGGTVSVHHRQIVVTGVSLRTGQRFTVTYGGNTRIAPRSEGVAAFPVAERFNADTTLTALANPTVSVSVKARSRSVLVIVGLGGLLVGVCAAGAVVARWIRHRPRSAGASRVQAIPHTGGPGIVAAQRTGAGPTITVRLETHPDEITTSVERVGAMTSGTAAAQPHTALALLVGGADPEVDLGRLWDGPTGAGVAAALSRIEPVLRAAARLEITRAATGLLQLDLISMLVDGWRKYEDLIAVARRTLEKPGSTELAELASHRVTAGEHPYIDVVVDGRTIATIRLELTVVFDVTVLAVSVRAARIVALHSGRTDITATLSVDGVEAPAGHEAVDLPLSVSLGNGIPLLSDADQREVVTRPR